MIESLNVILLTAPELFELRMRLKELKTAVSNPPKTRNFCDLLIVQTIFQKRVLLSI